jgi:RNA methyltransferase, TrmH family
LMTKYDMKIMAGHPESSSDGSKVTHSLSKELADSLVNESLCLVLGSEGNGLSAEILQTCDLVNIPMEGTFESLNVSVAGGIILFMLQHKHQINSRTLTP